MWAPHSPEIPSWSRVQAVGVSLMAGALALLPVRPERRLPPREAGGDPRPPGSVLLYEESLEANGAAPEAFEALPGIGSAKARHIVARREALGGFCAPEEVLRAAGIPKRRWERAARALRVSPAARCSSSSRG